MWTGDENSRQPELGANRHTTSITISTTVNFLYYEEGMSPLYIVLCLWSLHFIQVAENTFNIPGPQCLKLSLFKLCYVNQQIRILDYQIIIKKIITEHSYFYIFFRTIFQFFSAWNMMWKSSVRTFEIQNSMQNFRSVPLEGLRRNFDASVRTCIGLKGWKWFIESLYMRATSFQNTMGRNIGTALGCKLKTAEGCENTLAPTIQIQLRENSVSRY